MVNYKWPFSIAIYIYISHGVPISPSPSQAQLLSSAAATEYREPGHFVTSKLQVFGFFWEPLAKAIIYEYFYVYDIDSCIHRQYIIHTYMSYVIHIYIYIHSYIHTIPDHTRPDQTIPLHTYNIHTYRHTDIQTYRHTDRQTYILTYIYRSFV